MNNPFDTIFGDSFGSFSPGPDINPATSLPMIGPGIGGIDIAGNPYGTKLQDSDIVSADWLFED